MPTEQAYDRTSPIAQGPVNQNPYRLTAARKIQSLAVLPLESVRWSYYYARQEVTGQKRPPLPPIKPLTAIAIYAGLASTSYFLWRRSL